MLPFRAGPIAAIALAVVTAGCSLLAPSDDELMPTTAGAGAAGPVAGSGAAGGAAGAGGGGGRGAGYCASRTPGDPTARFCEDFDDGEDALSPKTWTELPGAPTGAAELVTEPHRSAPSAARVQILESSGCDHAVLARRLIGTADDPEAAPTALHLHMAIAANEDGFFGRVFLASSCVAILTVHEGGTVIGFEFQGQAGNAWVDYPVETSIFGRMPRVQWGLDLATGAATAAVDGLPLTSVEPFEIPPECRTALVSTDFDVGLACQDEGTVVVDDVAFGTD
jgi:hypothetical protein